MKKLMLIAVSLVGIQAWGSAFDAGLTSNTNMDGYVRAARMQSAFCAMESVKINSVSYNVPELKNHSVWDLSPLIYSMKLENYKSGYVMTYFGKGIDSATDSYIGEKLYFTLYSNFDFFNSFEIEVYIDDSQSRITNMVVKTYKIIAVNTGSLLDPQLSNKSQEYLTIGYKCN